MEKNEVSLVVTGSMTAVGQRLRDVEAWSAWLPDVERISKVAHERYTFHLVNGSYRRDLLVAVHEHGNTVNWKVLRGPCFDGQLRVADAGLGRTRVSVSLIRWPEGFTGGVVDMLMHGQDRVEVDEIQLRQHLVGAPAGQPIPDE